MADAPEASVPRVYPYVTQLRDFLRDCISGQLTDFNENKLSELTANLCRSVDASGDEMDMIATIMSDGSEELLRLGLDQTDPRIICLFLRYLCKAGFSQAHLQWFLKSRTLPFVKACIRNQNVWQHASVRIAWYEVAEAIAENLTHSCPEWIEPEASLILPRDVEKNYLVLRVACRFYMAYHSILVVDHGRETRIALTFQVLPWLCSSCLKSPEMFNEKWNQFGLCFNILRVYAVRPSPKLRSIIKNIVDHLPPSCESDPGFLCNAAVSLREKLIKKRLETPNSFDRNLSDQIVLLYRFQLVVMVIYELFSSPSMKVWYIHSFPFDYNQPDLAVAVTKVLLDEIRVYGIGSTGHSLRSAWFVGLAWFMLKGQQCPGSDKALVDAYCQCVTVIGVYSRNEMLHMELVLFPFREPKDEGYKRIRKDPCAQITGSTSFQVLIRSPTFISQFPLAMFDAMNFLIEQICDPSSDVGLCCNIMTLFQNFVFCRRDENRSLLGKMVDNVRGSWFAKPRLNVTKLKEVWDLALCSTYGEMRECALRSIFTIVENVDASPTTKDLFKLSQKCFNDKEASVRVVVAKLSIQVVTSANLCKKYYDDEELQQLLAKCCKLILGDLNSRARQLMLKLAVLVVKRRDMIRNRDDPLWLNVFESMNHVTKYEEEDDTRSVVYRFCRRIIKTVRYESPKCQTMIREEDLATYNVFRTFAILTFDDVEVHGVRKDDFRKLCRAFPRMLADLPETWRTRLAEPNIAPGKFFKIGRLVEAIRRQGRGEGVNVDCD